MEMLKIHNNPPRREWPALTARCTRQEGEITERVAAILSQVRTGGDKALRDLVARIEGYVPERFEVSRRQRTEAAKAVPQRLKTALAIAKSNIEAFHRAQLPPQAFYNAFADPRTGEYNVAAVHQFLSEAEANAQIGRAHV